MALDHLKTGATVIGTGEYQGKLIINTVVKEEKPSVLCMHATTDTTGVKTPYYIWVDTDGKLRIGSAVPTNQDGSGTIIGDMS